MRKMGILHDTYNIVNHLSGLHKYVGAEYTLHMYDILQTAQTVHGNADLFASYDSSLFGLSDYPIFNESKRKELNDVIISHFLTHEIGFETEYLFRVAMRAKMFSIMSRYNAMLSTIEQMNEKQDATTTNEHTTLHTEDRTNENNTKNRFSDTPQQDLDNVAVETESGWVDKYLTSATINDDKGKGTMVYTHKDTGRNMSYGKLVDELSTEKFAVYDMICKDLSNLFLGLFA